MCATALQPLFTIYNDEWEPARNRVARVASARYRHAYGAVLDSVEDGWEILRPLVLIAELFICEHLPRWPAARDVSNLIWMEVCEPFREVAGDCCDAVPKPEGSHREALALRATDTAEEVQRNLHVLRLAAAHVEFPPQMRELAVSASNAFDLWLERFRVVVAPVAEVEHAVV